MRRWWVLCGVLGLWLGAGCDNAPEEAAPTATAEAARPVKVWVVGAGEGARSGLYPGRVQAATQVKLSFRVAGRVSRVLVSPGQTVQAGQLLAELDPVHFRSQLDVAKAEFEEAKSALERYRKLFERSATSAAELEQRERTYQVRVAELNKAEENLADTRLEAPFRGIVAESFLDTHMNIAAEAPALTLQSLEQLRVVIDLPEREITTTAPTLPEALKQVALDQFWGTRPGHPQIRFQLTPVEFTTEADPYSQTYRITFDLEKRPELRLLPGMSMLVHLPVTMAEQDSEGVAVPGTALVRRDGAVLVWRVGADDRLEAVPVTIRGYRGELTEVTGNLHPGDRIVMAGAERLAAGVPVRVLSRLGTRPLTPETEVGL